MKKLIRFLFLLYSTIAGKESRYPVAILPVNKRLWSEMISFSVHFFKYLSEKQEYNLPSRVKIVQSQPNY